MSGNSAEWHRTDFEDDEFRKLVQKLGEYIVKATGKEFTGSEALLDAVHDAIQYYEIDRDIASGLYTSTLQEKPLAQVIEQIEGNKRHVILALGDYNIETGFISKEFAVVENEYQAVLACLRKIAGAIEPPAKRSVGRPYRYDLRMFVERLAAYWEFATGLEFTQFWHDGVPGTGGTHFVYEVLKFVDPAALPHLPKMTEVVVRERRKAQKAVGEDPRLKTLCTYPFLHRKIYGPVKDG